MAKCDKCGSEDIKITAVETIAVEADMKHIVAVLTCNKCGYQKIDGIEFAM